MRLWFNGVLVVTHTALKGSKECVQGPFQLILSGLISASILSGSYRILIAAFASSSFSTDFKSAIVFNFNFGSSSRRDVILPSSDNSLLRYSQQPHNGYNQSHVTIIL